MFGLDWRDLRASFVVVLVALPFCVGVAGACGLGIERGVLTAILGGLVAGRLGGAPLQISGPAVSMGAVLAPLVAHHGAASLGPAVFVMGALQGLAGLLRLGAHVRAIAAPVLAGAVCAAGLTQLAAQLYGSAGVASHGLFVANVAGLPQMLAGSHPAALAVAGLTLLVASCWDRLARGLLRAVPGAVAGVASGALLAAACPGLVAHVPPVRLDVLQVPGAGLLPGIWGVLRDPSLLATAALLAVMGGAESLASALALLPGGIGARAGNRELVAQAVGNMLCGIAGALPMAGAIPRSAANVRAGAAGSHSNMLHALWLAGLVLLAPRVLTWLPVPSLAALLVLGGTRVACSGTEAGAAFGAQGQALFSATVLAGLAVNLPVGIAAGVVCSCALAAKNTRARSRAVAQAA